MICQNCFRETPDSFVSLRVEGGCICKECMVQFKRCPKCWMLIHRTNLQRYCWDCCKEVECVQKYP